MGDCDHGWVHLCGGPHDVPDGDKRKVVAVRSPEDGGCQTVRCANHCSCFAPDGEHDLECLSPEAVDG